MRRYTLGHAMLVVWSIGWADFTARYHRSFAGYLWSLTLPATKLFVLFYVFRPLLGQGIPNYPLYLFTGLIVWEHFALITHKSMGVLQEKSGLIQRVQFPRIILLLSTGCTALLVALTYFAVYIACSLVLGVPLGWSLLYVPIALLQMTLFGLGVGMLLSAYSLKFPDLEHVWNMLLQVFFWLTPIIYPHALEGPIAVSLVRYLEEGRFHSIAWIVEAFIELQPLSIIIHDARRALLYTAETGMPSLVHIFGVIGILLIFFLLATSVFVRRSRSFVQEY